MRHADLPPGWTRERLGDVADYVNGFAFKPYHWKQTGLPIIRIAQMQNESAHCDRYPGAIPERNRIDSGDLLFSWSATLTALIWRRGPAYLNQHIFKVIPRPGNDLRFLHQLLNYEMEGLAGQSHGTTMKHITRADLIPYEVLCPPLPEQQLIASILDTVDEVIRKTEEVIAKLQQMKQGLLHDLLTRGIDDNGELRDPDRHPEQFKDSPLGRIPKDWEVRSVREVATRVTDGDHHTPLRAESGVLLLSARNVCDGHIDLSNVDYVPEAEYERMIRRCHPQEGDVLISCSGTIGRVALVPRGMRCALVRSAALVKPDPRSLKGAYGVVVIGSDLVQRQIRAGQRQAVQSNLFQAEIAALLLPLPHLEEQDEITQRVDRVDLRISAEQAELQKLRLLKSGLMDDLLTGRVRVTDLLPTP